MKVALVGASGETGVSIANALVDSGNIDIISLARESSLSKPINVELQKKGVKLVPTDLNGPEEELVKILSGVDVVISTIDAGALAAQIPLANAAKAAGVGRFIPCSFATIAPPRGVMELRELKENVIDHIKKIKLPYTIIDVGWWYQISLPRVPSGRLDYAVITPTNSITGDGDTLSALTDLRDIGRYVARIISDPRTLNKFVFAYNELWSQNKIYDLVEKLTGEKIERQHVSEAELLESIAKARESKDRWAKTQVWSQEYRISWGIRGDNVPEYAKYLGYLDVKELYPDMKWTAFETFVTELVEGKGIRPYQHKSLG